MIQQKYISPFVNNDEEEDEPKEEKSAPIPDFINKKMEKLFFEKRAVYLWGPVEDKSARDVVSKLLLLEADKPGEDIKFYINSPGGQVSSGMAIYDTMQYIKPDVQTICIGQAASMGSLLLAAGAPKKRFALPHSRIMIHQPSGGFQGQHTDIEIQAKEISRIRAILDGILAKHSGKDVAEINKDTERDYYMTAEEAKTYGLIDSVISNREEVKKDKK